MTGPSSTVALRCPHDEQDPSDGGDRPQVSLGDDNVIGPFSVLEGLVRIGDGNYLGSHVSVGAGPEVYGHPFAPGWEEETDDGGVVIGPGNTFEEFVAVDTRWQSQTVSVTTAC